MENRSLMRLIEKSLQCIKEAYRGRKPALAVVRIGNDGHLFHILKV